MSEQVKTTQETPKAPIPTQSFDYLTPGPEDVSRFLNTNLPPVPKLIISKPVERKTQLIDNDGRNSPPLERLVLPTGNGADEPTTKDIIKEATKEVMGTEEQTKKTVTTVTTENKKKRKDSKSYSCSSGGMVVECVPCSDNVRNLAKDNKIKPCNVCVNMYQKEMTINNKPQWSFWFLKGYKTNQNAKKGKLKPLIDIVYSWGVAASKEKDTEFKPIKLKVQCPDNSIQEVTTEFFPPNETFEEASVKKDGYSEFNSKFKILENNYAEINKARLEELKNVVTRPPAPKKEGEKKPKKKKDVINIPKKTPEKKKKKPEKEVFTEPENVPGKDNDDDVIETDPEPNKKRKLEADDDPKRKRSKKEVSELVGDFNQVTNYINRLKMQQDMLNETINALLKAHKNVIKKFPK